MKLEKVVGLGLIGAMLLIGTALGQSVPEQKLVEEQTATTDQTDSGTKALRTNRRPTALDIMGVDPQQAQAELDEFNRKREQARSNSRGSNVRVTGRSVKGVIVLVCALGAGLFKWLLRGNHRAEVQE